MLHKSTTTKTRCRVPPSTTNLNIGADASVVTNTRARSICENRGFCDNACPPSHLIAPLIIELEAVFPTVNCDDRPADSLLVEEHTDNDDVGSIIENILDDMLIQYNPPHTLASYRVILNNIWRFLRNTYGHATKITITSKSKFD